MRARRSGSAQRWRRIIGEAGATRGSKENTSSPHAGRSHHIGADQRLLGFLGLAAVRGVGSRTLSSIASNGRTFHEVFETDDTEDVLRYLRHHGARLSGEPDADWRSVRERALDRAFDQIERFSRDGVTIVFRDDPDYPPQLLDLAAPPPWLFVQGDLSVLHRAALTVVGTREPSRDGLWLCDYVGHCLGDWGAPTVSGLANGIDQSIHEASIVAGVPTVAFLGTGIYNDYPKGSEDLRRRIVEAGGAIVTEYLPSESYSRANFVQRNRLQAALGRILIPVEWAVSSGTAHTVRFAAELRRTIATLRVPSWPHNRVRAAGEGGRTFTLPGEDAAFRDHVAEVLDRPLADRGSSHDQLDLFGT